MTSWDGPSSSKAAPSDLPPWVGQLTASLSDVLTQQLASILKPAEPLDPPLKKAKASGGGPSPLLTRQASLLLTMTMMTLIGDLAILLALVLMMSPC